MRCSISYSTTRRARRCRELRPLGHGSADDGGRGGVEDLVNARKLANKIADEHQKAIDYHDKVEPKFDEIRYQIDKLELIVDDSLWPLPKYRELLFIR